MKNTYSVHIGAFDETGMTFTNFRKAKRHLRSCLENILRFSGPSDWYGSSIHKNGDEYPVLVAGIGTGKVKFERT